MTTLPPTTNIKRSLSTSPPPPPPSTSTIQTTTSQIPIPSTSILSSELPSSKRLKLNESTTTTTTLDSPTTTTIQKPIQKSNPNKLNKQIQRAKSLAANGGKKNKGIHKPGGAEETGQFDVIELLGLERFEEMRSLEEIGLKVVIEGEEGKERMVKRNWKKESEIEWGMGKEGKDLEVRIVGMSAHGDGLAILTPSNSLLPTRLLSIPFTLPGELILAHIHRHEPDFYLSHGDLIKILEPSSDRLVIAREGGEKENLDKGIEVVVGEELRAVREKFGERVMCKYFGTCSGCQYQPLSYPQQLLLKQSVVQKAFANFSNLSPHLIPAIGSTIPSPKEYAYRTKLTPHFQSPPNLNTASGSGGKSWNQRNKGKKGKGKEVVLEEGMEGEEEGERKEWELTIGFEEKGRKRIVDIEECVIATKVINDALVIQRQKIKDTISTYKRGSTLLLRDSLPPRIEGTKKPFPLTTSTEKHICITDHHEVVREQIQDLELEQMAGSFFQNNNSILPSLLNYIREVVHPSSSSSSSSLLSSSIDSSSSPVPPTTTTTNPLTPKLESEKTYLIDAYCGSGLFAIGLADQFDEIEGVEIDKASVKWAKLNAEFNKGEGRGEIGFRAGNAEAIFDTIKFPPSQTTIVIDPPRKGCDPLFLSQLLSFNPSTIIYISCNVHTQARDIGYLIKESNKLSQIDSQTEGEGEGEGEGEVMMEEGKGGWKRKVKGFWIESLRAADLFANTHHAEGVAVLRRHV